MHPGRIRVFLACSLDGFIAGPRDELDWLPAGDAEIEDTFTPFLAQIGAIVMGRNTFEVVTGFDAWPYGEIPMLVATSRPLVSPRAWVSAVGGNIDEMLNQARQVAGERDVYLDGGALVRSALDAGVVDELTLTLVPVVLGAGKSLFSGVTRRRRLGLRSSRDIGGGLVQLVYEPVPP